MHLVIYTIEIVQNHASFDILDQNAELDPRVDSVEGVGQSSLGDDATEEIDQKELGSLTFWSP